MLALAAACGNGLIDSIQVDPPAPRVGQVVTLSFHATKWDAEAVENIPVLSSEQAMEIVEPPRMTEPGQFRAQVRFAGSGSKLLFIDFHLNDEYRIRGRHRLEVRP